MIILIGIVSAVAATISGISWWRQTQINQYVMGERDTAPSKHPHVLFHQATVAAAEEDRQLARDLYTELGLGEAASLRAAAYYNRGNVNLNYALILPEGHPKKLPLIELAKQDYRTALGFAPQDKDARYNLALALRQIPEGPIALSESPRAPPIEQDREIETVDFTSDLP